MFALQVLNPDKPLCSKELVTQLMGKLPESTSTNWAKFTKGKLADINERNKIVPATSYSNALSSSEDDDAEFRDLQFPQEAALQQVRINKGLCGSL